MKKIIALLLCVVCVMSILSGCGRTSSNVLDFDNFSNSDLKKKIGQEVTIYGYFTLNSTVKNMVYVANLPFSAVYNEQTDNEKPNEYTELSLKDDKVITVFFKTTPEYTSTLLKITGIIKKVDYLDTSTRVKSIYGITDATYSPADYYAMDEDISYFAKFAQNGYGDIVYQNILNMQMFASKITEEFPEELKYAEIAEDLSKVSKYDMALLKEYKAIFNSVHEIHENYQKQYDENKASLDYDKMNEDIHKVLDTFFDMIEYYASFKIIPDSGNGFDKIEAVNHPKIVVEDDSSETSTATPNAESTNKNTNSETESTATNSDNTRFE